MSQEHEAAKVLEFDAAAYLRQVTIVVNNDINLHLGTHLAVTLAEVYLSPDSGTWDTPGPSQGDQILFGKSERWSASNRTYPGGVSGFMVFAVQNHGTARLDFSSTLYGYGATVNSYSDVALVGGVRFFLSTLIDSENNQPIFVVQVWQ